MARKRFSRTVIGRGVVPPGIVVWDAGRMREEGVGRRAESREVSMPKTPPAALLVKNREPPYPASHGREGKAIQRSPKGIGGYRQAERQE
eukprot:8311373-Heterocapsa_arctica.AAC.1